MMAALRLHIDGETFRDTHNRQVTLHGINIAGDSKFPATPDVPSHVREHFFDGDDVSFINRPFSPDQAREHFSRLKRWGYNTIRYIFTWEALEHEGPGKYDEEYIDYTIKILRIAKDYGFYIFMDPHQDVWSRFTGGSGAPMWTIYACGLDPTKFYTTGASVVQNTWPDIVQYPKMIWATNYTRLASQTLFTLFFSGKDFAPKCIIDGKNIQDYLQDHFVDACKHLAQRIRDAGDLEGDVVIGYETMNEPNRGYVGHPDLTKVPREQKLRKWTTPTAWQALLAGSGRAVEVEVWDFGSLGPYKSGSQLIDPKGTSAWLDPSQWDDTKYGWKRSPEWKLGTCIWAQHGVWNPTNDELLLPQYFARHPKSKKELNIEYWTNNYFMDYYRKHRDAMRSIWPQSFMLMQPAPFDIPPHIKGTPDGDDPNMIFASHFYDGITLITKKWNKLWNIDVLGILRGKYTFEAFALKVGETAIRKCFMDQLCTIRKEGMDYMGVHPCLFTEIGIPYDMDDQRAYKTGDYSSQISAVDANYFAIEGSGVAGLTWWVYTATSNHFWGDNWNGEDLSIYCSEDRPLPSSSYAPSSGAKPLGVAATVSSVQQTSTLTSDVTAGFRAAEAYIRPTPIFTHGKIESYGFDLKSCTFNLCFTAPSSTPSDLPTEVFLPDFHFPQLNQQTSVEVSGGKWQIKVIETEEGAPQQIFQWWHGEGEQKCTIKGVRRKLGQGIEEDAPEDNYLETYLQMGKNCTIM